MLGEFERGTFLNLIEELAKAKGPSLSEGPRRGHLARFLNNNGVTTATDLAGNLMVVLGAGHWKETVVFDAHMDVVQQGYTDGVVYDDGLIKGLGVGDNLTAVALLALMAVSINNQKNGAEGLKRPLVILFSVGEEGHGNLKGVKEVVKNHPESPFLFLSFDLSFEEYSIQGLGSTRYNLNVECPGGHSWENYGSPSSIGTMLDFFSRLSEAFQAMVIKHPNAISFNIGTLEGGEGINSISRSASATFEFRSVLPEPLKYLGFEVELLCKDMNKRKGVVLACDVTGRRPASEPVKPERIEPLVRDILSGVDENTRAVIRSTNINATLDAGWPSLCMGLCRGGNYHTPNEFVVVDSIEKGWTVLSRLVKSLVM
jgi:acetylornithine deacetylase/succinyl-diaminopimelate desuccinylase-like protein